MLSFAQTGLDLRRPTTDLDPGLVRLINLDKRSEEVRQVRSIQLLSTFQNGLAYQPAGASFANLYIEYHRTVPYFMKTALYIQEREWPDSFCRLFRQRNRRVASVGGSPELGADERQLATVKKGTLWFGGISLVHQTRHPKVREWEQFLIGGRHRSGTSVLAGTRSRRWETIRRHRFQSQR
jgi:hypothetical protein